MKDQVNKISTAEWEDFKKNHLKKIESVAKSKTEWLKPFQEVYQDNRNEKKRLYKLK